MGSKLKEDERNERTIRGLLKQSENRRCINCGSLGPQYVCTTFSIFVCTNCSGLHREFSHRIKSVSMAKFTAEEVKNLQNGGNERGRELYLKDFDFQRHSLPDSSNPERLREFIRNVYEYKRYSVERPPTRGRQGDRDDSSYDPKFDPRQDSRPSTFNNRSPSLEERAMDRRRSDLDRARYDGRQVHFDEKRSPSKVEPERSRYSPRSVSAQYDRNFRQSDDRNYSNNNNYRGSSQDQRDWDRDRDRRGGSYDDRQPNETVANHGHDRRRSADDRPYANRDSGDDGPPIRPVSEILGTNVPTLWVEEYRQTNGREEVKLGVVSTAELRKDLRIPRPASVGNVANGGALDAVPVVTIKRVNSGSLIDFLADAEPSAASISAVDPFGLSSVVPSEVASDPTSSAGWATFDTGPSVAAAVAAVPRDALPAGYPKDGVSASSNGDEWAAGGWPSTQHPASSTQAASTAPVDDWLNLSTTSLQPQQQPAAPSGPQQVLQHWNSFPTAMSDAVSNSEPARVQNVEEAKANSGAPVSRELPKDLFSHSWDGVSMPPGGMLPFISTFPAAGHHQVLAPGSMPPHGQPPRSRNPFEFPSDGAASAGMGSFPSLGPLQAALPNGPSSVPVGGPTAAANQWGSFGLPPASFPRNVPDAVGSSYASHVSMPSSMRHGPAVGAPLTYLDVGSLHSHGMSGSDISLSGSFEFPSRVGSSEFPPRSESSEFPQNFARTSSGNPFG